MRDNVVLFYSSVKNIEEFHVQRFYAVDIEILKELGYNVILTNRIFDFVRLKYDIAFLYFHKWSVFPAIFAKLKSKNVFITGGADDISDNLTHGFLKKIFIKLLFVTCYIFAKKINIVSESDLFNARAVLANFLLKGNKLIYFPHSYSDDFITFEDQQKNPDYFSICWMSTIGNVKRKGLDKALEFFSKISEFDKKGLFYIIGTIGEGTDYLKTLECYEKVKNRVVFTGYLSEDEKNAILKSSMFCLQLSQYEGFGLAALEANFFKCFIFHSGSGGFLSSSDIWGKKIDIGKNFTNELIETELKNFNYFSELSEFDKRYNYFTEKHSKNSRKNNLQNILNE